MSRCKFSWAIHSKLSKGREGVQVTADRLEITATGGLVFYQREDEGDVIVHVQAPGSFMTCTVLSGWGGEPSHVEKLEPSE